MTDVERLEKALRVAMNYVTDYDALAVIETALEDK